MTARRAIALLLCLLLLTGCWNRREIETLGFVLGLGIDWDEEEGVYELTMQMAQVRAQGGMGDGGGGGGGGGGGPPSWVFISRGETIFDAVRKMATLSPRRAWWGHTQVMVLGEEMARRGVLPALDFAVRDGEMRRLMWVLVTPGKARDILTHEAQSDPVGAMGLMKMIRARGATSTSGAVRLHDFKVMLSSPASAVTGLVRLADHAVTGPSSDFLLVGSAVFARDKLVGFLDRTETRGMLWVKAKVVSGIVLTPCPGEPDELVGLEIVLARSRIRPRLRNGKLELTVGIWAESNLGDKTCLRKISTPEGFEKLDAGYEQAIRSEVEEALSKAWEMGTDIFGFSTRIQQELPAVWRRIEPEWDGVFRDLPIFVEVTAKVRRQGLQSGTPTPR